MSVSNNEVKPEEVGIDVKDLNASGPAANASSSDEPPGASDPPGDSGQGQDVLIKIPQAGNARTESSSSKLVPGLSLHELEQEFYMRQGWKRYYRRNTGEVLWVWNKDQNVFQNLWARLLLVYRLRFWPYLVMFCMVGFFAGAYLNAANWAATRYLKYGRGIRNIGGMIVDDKDVSDPYAEATKGKTAPSDTYPSLNLTPRDQPDGVPSQGRLPDVILDALEYPKENTFLFTTVADLIPMGLGGLATALLILEDHAVYTVIGGNLFALNWFFNMLGENMTILPSSYGYERCLKTRSKGVLKHGDDHVYDINPTGSCAAMMWSGHSWNVITFGYWVLLCARYRYPKFWGQKLFGCCKCVNATETNFLVNSKAGLLLIFLALFEAFLLLVDFAHYSVDIYIAWLLAIGVLSNDRFLYWLYYMNPYATVPFEHNVVYQRMKLRKIRALRRRGALGQLWEHDDAERTEQKEETVIFNPWSKEDQALVREEQNVGEATASSSE